MITTVYRLGIVGLMNLFSLWLLDRFPESRMYFAFSDNLSRNSYMGEQPSGQPILSYKHNKRFLNRASLAVFLIWSLKTWICLGDAACLTVFNADD